MKEDTLKGFYFKITDIWKRLCEQHKNLYESTLDEYKILLSGEIDELDNVLIHKNKIIEEISNLEHLRQQNIVEINDTLENNSISSVHDLIIFIKKYESDMNSNYFIKFNQLLIDLIENITQQNKINQLFINKAILSLDKIKNYSCKDNHFKTYDRKGSTSKSSLNINR